MALKLQEKYLVLLNIIQVRMRNVGDLEAIKTVVKTTLSEISTQSYNIEHYSKRVDMSTSSDSLFHFLIDEKLVGYLNPAILGNVAMISDDEHLQRKMKQYEYSYWKLVLLPDFEKVLDALTSHAASKPSNIIGLPMSIVYLGNAWINRSKNDVKQYLSFAEECSVHILGSALLSSYAEFDDSYMHTSIIATDFNQEQSGNYTAWLWYVIAIFQMKSNLL